MSLVPSPRFAGSIFTSPRSTSYKFAPLDRKPLPMIAAPKPPKAKAACLGVIRLDYDYPPAPGDIDSPDSFAYDVYYRVVPGLTFEMC